MNVDVWLGVLLTIMAVLGGVISAIALPKYKRAGVIAFIVLGGVAVYFVVIQAQQNQREKADAQRQQILIQAKLDRSLEAQKRLEGENRGLIQTQERLEDENRDLLANGTAAYGLLTILGKQLPDDLQKQAAHIGRHFSRYIVDSVGPAQDTTPQVGIGHIDTVKASPASQARPQIQ